MADEPTKDKTAVADEPTKDKTAVADEPTKDKTAVADGSSGPGNTAVADEPAKDKTAVADGSSGPGNTAAADGSSGPETADGAGPAASAAQSVQDLGIRQVFLGEREFVVLIVMGLLLLCGVQAKSCLMEESVAFTVTGKVGGKQVELVSLKQPPLWKAYRRPVAEPRIAEVELIDLSGGATFPARVSVTVEKLPAGVSASDPQAVAVYFMANARHHRPLLHVMGWAVTSVGGRKCLRADYAYAANPKSRGSEMGSHTDVPVTVRGVDLFFGVRDRGYHISLRVLKSEFAAQRRRYETLVRSVVVK